jgi:hypothetical protein
MKDDWKMVWSRVSQGYFLEGEARQVIKSSWPLWGARLACGGRSWSVLEVEGGGFEIETLWQTSCGTMGDGDSPRAHSIPEKLPCNDPQISEMLRVSAPRSRRLILIPNYDQDDLGTENTLSTPSLVARFHTMSQLQMLKVVR